MERVSFLPILSAYVILRREETSTSCKFQGLSNIWELFTSRVLLSLPLDLLASFGELWVIQLVTRVEATHSKMSLLLCLWRSWDNWILREMSTLGSHCKCSVNTLQKVQIKAAHIIQLQGWKLRAHPCWWYLKTHNMALIKQRSRLWGIHCIGRLLGITKNPNSHVPWIEPSVYESHNHA